MNAANKPLVTTTLVIIILTILFLVTLGTTNYFVNSRPLLNDTNGTIRLEIIKSLLHVLVVIIIGGIVTALFKAYERSLEQTKIHTQMKLDFIKRIGQLYRLIKRTRRKLREQGIRIHTEKEQIEINKKQYEIYAGQMEVLNDIQLEMEGMKIAAANSFLFRNSEQIAEHLWRMEDYLNNIHAEFENGNPGYQTAEQVDLSNLQYLREFTYNANNRLLSKEIKKYDPKEIPDQIHYCFKTIFSNSYGKILRDLK